MKRVLLMTAACAAAIAIGCASSSLPIVGGELPAGTAMEQSVEQEVEVKTIGLAAIESKAREVETRSAVVRAASSGDSEAPESRGSSDMPDGREDAEAQDSGENDNVQGSREVAWSEDDEAQDSSGSGDVQDSREDAEAQDSGESDNVQDSRDTRPAITESLDAGDSIFRRFTEEEIIFQEEEPMYDGQSFYEEPELEDDDTLNDGAGTSAEEMSEEGSFIGGLDDIDAEAMEAGGMRAE